MKLRKIKTLLVGASVLVASLVGRSLSTSTVKGAGANDGNTLPSYSVININNMAYWMKKSSAGTTSGSPNGTQADYPIGTGGLVYEDGFLWGAKVKDNAIAIDTVYADLDSILSDATFDTTYPYRVRVGGTTYYAGLHAGYVKYNTDGDVECLGRKDNQIKIAGRRIEIGEIEGVLRKYQALKDVVVVPVKNSDLSIKLLLHFSSASVFAFFDFFNSSSVSLNWVCKSFALALFIPGISREIAFERLCIFLTSCSRSLILGDPVA